MLESFAERGMALLLDASLKSLLLLAVAGLALWGMKRASAAARHLVLLLTLMCLLLLPLLSSALPGWQVRIWPHAATAGPPPVTDSAGAQTSDGPPVSAPSALNSTPPGNAAVPIPVLPAAPTPLRTHPRTSWPLLGFGLWILGVCLTLAPVLAGLVGVHCLGRRSPLITADGVTALAADLGRELGLRRRVTLRQGTMGDLSVMPMTWGWRRPIILLPEGAEDWSADRLRVVLLHELAHVRRGDWPWQMLAHGVCALYWFHPGVWLLARGLRIESERACDDQVLSAGVPAPDYAGHLLAVARTLSQTNGSIGVALPMATSQVEGRLRAIVQSHRRRDLMTKRVKFLTMFAAASLLLPLAALRPVSGAQKVSAPSAAVPAGKRFIVVVDPGHGGPDTGAVGPDGTREKDINLAIALKLRDTLTKDGATVILTRTGDTFLPVMARPAFARANKAQYFVSIHCAGWYKPADSRSGAAVYYHGANALDRHFASDVLANVTRVSALPAYGVLSDTTRFQAGFGVLRGSPVPAVLVECGFLNNANDLAALREEQTQQQIADGIAAGLMKFDAQRPKIKLSLDRDDSIQAKKDYAAAVHDHNLLILQFWETFAHDTLGVYQENVRRRAPRTIVPLFTPHYMLNGQPMGARQAAQSLREQIQQYGFNHHLLKIIKADIDAENGRATILVKGDRSAAGHGTDVAAFSRRDVWIRTPAGWRLTASDVK